MTDTESTYSREREKAVGDLNMALQQYVLDCLRVHGYRPKVTYMGDEYFIFSGYPNSIVEFTMSRTPGWRWGCWVYGENMDDPDSAAIRLFCQHKANIDKFKPSASDCCVEISYRDLHDVMYNDYVTKYVNEPWSMRKIAALADFVRMHPFLAYAGECDDYLPMGYHPSADMARGCARWAKDEASNGILRGASRLIGKAITMHPLVEEAHVSFASYPTSTVTVRIKDGVDEVPDWMACRRISLFGKCVRVDTVSHDGNWKYE